MQTITTGGLDIAKSVFQVHGVDARGNAVVRRQLKRRKGKVESSIPSGSTISVNDVGPKSAVLHPFPQRSGADRGALQCSALLDGFNSRPRFPAMGMFATRR